MKTKRGIKKSDVKKHTKKKERDKDVKVIVGKRKRGRPSKYTSAQEFQIKVDEYFDSCWVDKITEVTDKEGNCTMTTVHYQNRPYTIMGLALGLGFNSRQSLLNYEGDPKFLDVIKKAKAKVEMNVEELLLEGKNAAGPIFWLKNHADYRDRQEYEHSGPAGGPIEYSRLDLANRIASVLNDAKNRKEQDG